MSTTLPIQKIDPQRELCRLNLQQELERIYFLIMIPPDVYLNTLYSKVLDDLKLFLTETQISETEKHFNDIKDKLEEYIDLITSLDNIKPIE